MKYQIIISACGLIEDVAGPYPGRIHDAEISRLAMTHQRLLEFCTYPNGRGGVTTYNIYGDPAYGQSDVIYRN